MQIRTFARSFGGGEVTPEFFGRVDDTKFQTGLARCRNFIVKPHGPVENRGGFRLVREVKDSSKRTRLLPFTFAPTQTLVIEAGETYFRFHSDGGTLVSGLAPYEVAHPYQEEELFAVRYTQSNDVLTLCHVSHPPAELRRLGAISWTYGAITFAYTISPPTNVVATPTPAPTTPGPPTAQSYVVTSLSADGLEESLQSSGGVPTAITGISNSSPGLFAIPSSGSFAVNDDVYVSGVGGMSQVNNRFFKINSVTPILDPFDSLTVIGYTITLKEAGVPLDTTSFTPYAGGGTLTKIGTGSQCSNNLFDDGAFNTITWTAAPGASRYNVYKLTNGLFAYIGQTEQTTFTDDNIAGDLSKTPPINDVPFQGEGNYPGAVGYYEQRRVFAGTINQPSNAWLSRTGTERNMGYSIPSRADDSIRFRVAARERNTFRHVVPLSNLILLADAAEWRVTPNSGEALSGAESPSVRPQSFIGSADAAPVTVNNNLVFAAARGGHIRELGYSWQANGYVTGDLSLRAPHLFDNFEIVDMAYAKAPIPIVWAVSTSGKLLGFTYIPEQEVGAWHVHETDGFFESIAVVAEGDEDVLYAVIRRTINGSVRRFVERMSPRDDEFFVDCGLRYEGAPATVISGLSHLEGETVSILADGAVHPPRTVLGGSVTLDAPASKVDVGLPYNSDIQTLPMAFEAQGFGQGRPKNVNKVWFRVFESQGLRAGPRFDRLVEAKWRTVEAYGEPPSQRTGEIEITIPPSWQYDGSVCLRQSDPLPLTIVSMTLEVEVGG